MQAKRQPTQPTQRSQRKRSLSANHEIIAVVRPAGGAGAPPHGYIVQCMWYDRGYSCTRLLHKDLSPDTSSKCGPSNEILIPIFVPDNAGASSSIFYCFPRSLRALYASRLDTHLRMLAPLRSKVLWNECSCVAIRRLVQLP